MKPSMKIITSSLVLSFLVSCVYFLYQNVSYAYNDSSETFTASPLEDPTFEGNIAVEDEVLFNDPQGDETALICPSVVDDMESFNSNSCSSCHSLHSSEDPKLINTTEPTETLQESEL